MTTSPWQQTRKRLCTSVAVRCLSAKGTFGRCSAQWQRHRRAKRAVALRTLPAKFVWKTPLCWICAHGKNQAKDLWILWSVGVNSERQTAMWAASLSKATTKHISIKDSLQGQDVKSNSTGKNMPSHLENSQRDNMLSLKSHGVIDMLTWRANISKELWIYKDILVYW